MPVDPVPAAPVAGPLPHLRKLAFVFGAAATLIAILLVKMVLD